MLDWVSLKQKPRKDAVHSHTLRQAATFLYISKIILKIF